MLCYTDTEIKNIAENILNKRVMVYAIGNHELRRHLVYRIVCENGYIIIFKLYYIPNRRNREISALGLLSKSHIKCPSLLSFGNLKDGTEWAMFENIDGEVFDKVKHMIDHDNQLAIFTAMGEELGKIHGFKSFKFFGDWDENGNSCENIKDYYEYFKGKSEAYIKDTLVQKLPEEQLQRRASGIVRKEYDAVKGIKSSRLCHCDYGGRNVLVKRSEGKWHITGIIDFEHSIPGNSEIDIAGQYFTYFYENKEYEKVFMDGYSKYFSLDKGFYDRLHLYLLYLCFGVCSWAYKQSPEYYASAISLMEKLVDKNL